MKKIVTALLTALAVAAIIAAVLAAFYLVVSLLTYIMAVGFGFAWSWLLAFGVWGACLLAIIVLRLSQAGE